MARWNTIIPWTHVERETADVEGGSFGHADEEVGPGLERRGSGVAVAVTIIAEDPGECFFGAGADGDGESGREREVGVEVGLKRGGCGESSGRCRSDVDFVEEQLGEVLVALEVRGHGAAVGWLRFGRAVWW